MEFEEKIKEFSKRIEKLEKSIKTEEATKTSLIMPFFSLLGYDVFNPNEFTPEYIADIGIKKGEKVDYAITLNNELSIIIEAKSIKEDLKKHGSQLVRYFLATEAKLAILTNGIIYQFFTDIDNTNKMDATPFLTVNMRNLKETDIIELKKFCKENFDINIIINSASNLKNANSIEKILSEEFNEPSEEFIKIILSKGLYKKEGKLRITQNVIDKYKPIIKKSLNYYINSLVNQRLQTALNTSVKSNENIEKDTEENEIITTAEELESYYIIKAILAENINPNEIYYKDTYSYFNILYKNKVTKWICRVFIKSNTKFLIIPDKNKKEIRYDITNISDIYKLKQKLIDRLKSFNK